MRTLPALLLIAGVLASANGARAVDTAACPLERAVYASVEGGYTMRFKPVISVAAAVTHLFALEKDGLSMDGLVMPLDEPLHSVARVMKDCPDGDITGTDLAGCTGFEGYGFAISATGGVANLAQGSEPAPPTLLFAGLGPSLLVSPLGQKLGLKSAPSDAFQFKECAQ